MVCDDAAVEAEDGCGILGHAVVRPSCEVKLSHLQRAFRATRKLCLYVCACVYKSKLHILYSFQLQHHPNLSISRGVRRLFQSDYNFILVI